MSERFKRGAVAGEIIIKTAFEELNYWSKYWFSSSVERSDLKLSKQENIGEVLVKGLGRLKGSGLKILQNLALDEDLVPPAMLKKIENSFSKNPPMSSFVVKKILKIQYKEKLEKIFKNINYQAKSAASIGQVHRASLVSGEDVSIKVQFTHVKKDLSLEMSLLKKMAHKIDNSLVRQTIEDIADQILIELDYENEAINCNYFKQKILNKNIIIPTVYNEISSSNILVSNYIDGELIIDLLRKDQKVDQHICKVLYDFYFDSLFTHGLLHGDPHPGNYIITQDGKIAVLDYGIAQLNIPLESRELIKGLLFPDTLCEDDLLGLYIEMGAVLREGEKERFIAEVIRPYRDISIKITNKSEFDFGKNIKLIKGLRSSVLKQSFNPALKEFTTDLSLIHKVTQNLFLMLSRIKAKINTELPLK